MFKSRNFYLILFLLLLCFKGAGAHSIQYQVKNKGICTRFFYYEDEPANYAEYEIFGPGDEFPYMKGRTDKNGFVCFLPDRKGKWIIKVRDETEHGLHSVQVDIEVGKNMFVKSFKKPLVATHTGLLIGLGILGWLLYIASWIKNKK